MRVSCAKCHSQASITSPEQVAGTAPHFPNSILFVIEFLQPFRSPSNGAAAFGGRRSYIWTALRCLSNLTGGGSECDPDKIQKKKTKNKTHTHINTHTKEMLLCSVRTSIAALQPAGWRQRSLVTDDELFSLCSQIRNDTSGCTHQCCHQRLISSPSEADTGNYPGKHQHGIYSLQTSRNNAVGSSIKGSRFIILTFGRLIDGSNRVGLTLMPCCPCSMSGFGG